MSDGDLTRAFHIPDIVGAKEPVPLLHNLRERCGAFVSSFPPGENAVGFHFAGRCDTKGLNIA
jgi:hypothetical protein